ncbi:carboxymuconolactone decarboxylase family protein [Litoreibacter albidus]|uniref:carboxymuconolactone decarboxylase family protein n=1 Tax=Litoreibacter albidus TaxID=670155 RepID=UPI003736F588
MSWIKTIPYDEADARLKPLYDRVTGPDGNVDNIMMSHSLRPHSMEGHMLLYKNCIHHPSNTVPKWFLETIGVYVSLLNGCDYCVEHHFAGLRRLLADDLHANEIRAALEARAPQDTPLDALHHTGLAYAQKLTVSAANMIEADVAALRNAGWDDGQILEINQVTAYFNYANRTVLGLGCSLKGDVLGLSPNNSDDPDDWGHR